MKQSALLGIALFSLSILAQAQDPNYEGLDATQCARVSAITERWRATPLNAIGLAGIEDAPAPVDARPNADLDAANAHSRAHEELVGPCRFNEAEGRVEVKPEAFKLSDATLGQCLATAFAHARYYTIEAQWLKHLDAHEAWIVKNGVLTKVGVDTKIETTAARMLWTSFAVRELGNLPGSGAAAGDASRAIASTIDSPRAGSDPDVRKFLGLD
ncbi:MAG: hypothetical protein HY074_02590 [Deltaproteobacteria bacterium]|nr:hypothetical protein [Deltaproteobacteria bacterium]